MARCISSTRPAGRYWADRRHAAAEAHVQSVSGVPGALQRGVDAVGDEMKRGAAGHLNGGTRVMSEHEDRRVIRRVVAPPAFPLVVRPGTAYRPM
jgi:hypothetical protein